MPPSLRIQLFGPVQVLIDDEPAPRGPTRAVEWLLALLALRQNRAVERTWLAGTLWPDSKETRGLQNLRTTLVYLRRALGPHAGRIQSPTRATLRLDLAGAEVDLLEFDRAIRAGDEESLWRAVEVYTGPLLEGCYEDWALPERDLRAEQCLAALEKLSDRSQERGAHREAIVYLRRAELLDPLRETAVRRLMACLAGAGASAAAGEAYRQLRRRLLENGTAPDRETTLLYQQIRARSRAAAHSPIRRSAASTSVPVSAPPLRLSTPTRPPHPLTAIIGREAEIQAVRDLLAQRRLVTLTGAGGVGKTRLAMEVAGSVENEYAEGPVWVELASVREGSLLLPAVGAALGMETAGDAVSPLGRVIDRLSEGTCLLVLDNCEHMVEEVGLLAQQLLSRGSEVTVLATSRQRLGITGEVAWRVPSLPCPPHALNRRTGPDLHTKAALSPLEYPAVQLFVERAADVRPGFRLVTGEEIEAAARICRRLDGIPLALELAAARVNVLPTTEIATRLDDRFRLLTAGSRVTPARHQTLQRVIDWSYDLLSEPEQTLLRRLSVFAGGWTLEAAEAICGADDENEEGARTGVEGLNQPSTRASAPDILDLLASLEDKSLVLGEETPGGLRYRMLETVREYGREKLREKGEETAAQERHAQYFLALAELAAPFLETCDPAWIHRMEIGHDNLRAALAFLAAQESTEERAVRLAAALEPFWAFRGYTVESASWLVGLAKRRTAPTEARARLLAAAALLVKQDGDIAGARQMFVERLEIWRQLGDRRGIAAALNGVASCEADLGVARSLAEESLEIMRELGDQQGVGHSLYLLGGLARRMGDDDLARTRWLECREVDRERGVPGGHVLAALGELALDRGDLAEARLHYQAFLLERLHLGDLPCIAWALSNMAALARAEGDPERAARLLGAALALDEAAATPLPEKVWSVYQERRRALLPLLNEAAIDAAWNAGRAMSCEQAIACALEPSLTPAAS